VTVGDRPTLIPRREREPTPPEFLRELGVFIQPRFVSSERCQQTLEEMETAQDQAAGLVRGGVSVIDERVRRTRTVTVSESTADAFCVLFDELRPRLSEYFATGLSSFSPPAFLRYRIGDHFQPHPDNSGDPRQPHSILQRQVSSVLFLTGRRRPNSGSDRQALDTFDGGLLNFFRLADEPTWDNYCLPLAPEPGMLIAFRSLVSHEVTPVTSGVRASVVTWFG
jgi:SM-20-related protein